MIVENQIELSVKLLKNKNNNGALSLLEEILVENPDQIESLEKISILTFDMKLYTSSIRYNLYLLKNVKIKGNIYARLGKCHEKLQNKQLALEYYHRALEEYPAAIADYINMHLELHLQDEALMFMFNYEAKLESLSIEDKIGFYTAFAAIYADINNPTQSIECYLRAIQCCGTTFESVLISIFTKFNLSHTIIFPWHKPQVIDFSCLFINPEQLLLLALVKYPLLSPIFSNIGKQYAANNNHFFTLIFYFLSLLSHPTPSVCLDISIILQSFTQTTSEEFANFGLTIEATPSLYTQLGLLNLNNPPLATSYFKSALQLDYKHVDALFHFAELNFKSKFYSQAQLQYQNILQIDPSNKKAFTNLLFLNQFICDWRTQTKDFNKLNSLLDVMYKDVQIVPLNRDCDLSLLAQNPPIISPFHCFILPISKQYLKLISYLSASYALYTVLSSNWYPKQGYPNKPPKHDIIRVGYVSSDFKNHSLSHLMQHVFEYHNRSSFAVYGYATSMDDGSSYRNYISTSIDHFNVCHALSTKDICNLIVNDEIDILIDLNGYSEGKRTEIFAAKVAPIQMHYMGFPGPMVADYMDYCIGDRIAVPEKLLEDVFTEKLLYLPNSYFVTDHKQQLPIQYPFYMQEEQWQMHEINRNKLRKLCFPNLPSSTLILGSFNQLYKLSPDNLECWIRILQKTKNTVIWMLDFPRLGAINIKEFVLNCDPTVVDRFVFTETVDKQQHLERACIMDLFLDSIECTAHTTACDVLWSGVPIVTFPKYEYKMSCRVSSSILHATGYGHEMVVDSYAAYEQKILDFVQGSQLVNEIALPRVSQETGVAHFDSFNGPLYELKKKLLLGRDDMPLFDTKKWTMNLEKGLKIAYSQYLSEKEPKTIYVRDF